MTQEQILRSLRSHQDDAVDSRRHAIHVVDRLGNGLRTMRERADLLQGTLDLLVLKTLRGQPLHGWGISKRIREISEDVLQINQGSLYPALYRLEDAGWIEAEWGTSPEGRRAKFYHLTVKGRKQLTSEQADWRLFSQAVELVLANA